jgi:hypothetical protein
MAQLAISNVVTVSVSQAPAGLGAFNTSNLALFTREVYDPETFGDLAYKIYTGPSDVATDFGTDSDTYKMAVAVFSQKPNILAGNGKLVIIPFTSAEELTDAIERTKSLVQYYGIMQAEIDSQSYTLAAAATIQALNKMGFFVSRDNLDIAPDGTFDLFRQSGYTQSRGLYYGTDTDTKALVLQAGYASRALSVNFDGSNTTITMNLKDIIGSVADPTMTQTFQDQCTACGADTYPSIQGIAKVLSAGANRFFDQVYNQGWFVGALEVAIFNFLAQSSTKVPQTEAGMTAFKGAIRKVCNQAVTNGYVAPGTWNSPDTFGNLEDFLANVLQQGFYIYSQPIAQQSQAAREAREAPLAQVALKEAGAIQHADILVYINP